MIKTLTEQQEQKKDEIQPKKRRHPITMTNSRDETLERMRTVSERIEKFKEVLYGNTKDDSR
jgi:hypothetical protein